MESLVRRLHSEELNNWTKTTILDVCIITALPSIIALMYSIWFQYQYHPRHNKLDIHVLTP